MVRNLMIAGVVLLSGCATSQTGNVTATMELPATKGNEVRPGIPAHEAARIQYKQRGKTLLTVNLGEPVIVSMAEEPHAWGHFQFPYLFRDQDGGLVAQIHMSDDAVASYGNTQYRYARSADQGHTWQTLTPDETAGQVLAEGLLLRNGDRIKITTPPSMAEHDLQLPPPAGKTANQLTLYRHDDLPESRQGVFLARLPKGGSEWVPEKAKLVDPAALRYSIKGQIPVVWWGDLKEAADGSLIAGIYPGYYVRDDGSVDTKSGVFFYRSTDQGHSWAIQGRIPYRFDAAFHPDGEEFPGFTEPTFEILSDGSFVCVMRTTDHADGPMYVSRSTDMGATWSTPAPISAAGVLPKLLQLENGVVVLSSGRPGVQLRFAVDGKGMEWTAPFELVPYDRIGVVDWFTSCGYTSLMPLDDDRFLVIYSDFLTMNRRGQLRKSIQVREVQVTPRD